MQQYLAVVNISSHTTYRLRFHCWYFQTECWGSATAVHRCSDRTSASYIARKRTACSSPGKSLKRKKKRNYFSNTCTDALIKRICQSCSLVNISMRNLFRVPVQWNVSWETTVMRLPVLILKDQIFLAEVPTFQYNYTCPQRTSVLRDHICMANGVVFQDRFYCTVL